MHQRVQRGEVWSTLIIPELSDHTWVRQGACPPTEFSLEPPLPTGALPVRWTVGKGAGNSCFQARAPRPLLLIRRYDRLPL